jgi:hypothetical protein
MNPIETNKKTTCFPIETDATVSTRLAQEKIEARQQLSSLPPTEAQEIVEQTLYPQYWEYSLSEDAWEESLPSCYGETDS